MSIVIPTYNAEELLPNCLASIERQIYPVDKLEVVIVDGGSTDNTLDLAKAFRLRNEFHVQILFNKDRDAESGKSIGIQCSQGEIVALLDADNEIAQDDWLARMVVPLVKNSELFGVESFYLHNEKESILNRYFTAIELTDPLARFLAPKLHSYRERDYIVYLMPETRCPPIGANGFLWRRSVIEAVGGYIPRFEEANFVCKVKDHGFKKFAKIKGIGVHHYYVSSFRQFIKKRVKIAKKFMARKQKGQYTWIDRIEKRRFLKGVLFCATIVGPTYEAIREYRSSGDKAWLLHPVICLTTVLIYGIVFMGCAFSGLVFYSSGTRSTNT